MFLGQTRDTVPPRFTRGEELSADALSRLAPQQLVRHVDRKEWGVLREGKVVQQQRAAEVYEEVVRGQIDPAVFEYAGGNTFRGRVFPIPAKGYNRVILAYEETLPVVRDRLLYRFGLPGHKLSELRFFLQGRKAECLEPTLQPKGATKEVVDDTVAFTRTWENATPAGEVLFSFRPASPRAQWVSGRHGGLRHLYARLRPDVPAAGTAQSFAPQAVFLLDTSQSEGPERFAVSMMLLQAILEGDPDIKQFNILTFNAGAAWLEPAGWLPNNKAGRKKALALLDGLVLEGATDLSAALEKLCAPGFAVAKGTPLSCFLLSDGHLTWGETDVAALVAKFEARCPFRTRFHCYRTGLGEENAELYDALTRTGGAVFQCFGEADVATAAAAHRRHCLQVQRVSFTGGPAARDVLVAGRRAAVYPGGDLVVCGRFAGTGKTKVVVEGTYRGKKVVQEFPLEVADGGALAARAWAEVAVAGLLALHDANVEQLVTAYCQEFGIASRVASFLVLENDADYKRFKLDEEQARTFKGDLGLYLADAWARLGREVSGKVAFTRLLEQISPRTKVLTGAELKKLLGLLREEDFDLPAAALAGGLLRLEDADKAYLAGRQNDRRNVHPYLDEAKRRADAKDVAGAVRVLSSVVEEHPGRSDALRLVGYRLLDLRQPAQAARLFARVQKARPFEPHAFRDLARALEESGRYGLAALQYEAILAGTWHARFGPALKRVVAEEYAGMMQYALRQKAVSKRLADHFGERLEGMREPQPAGDLRVTISWNTDGTDVDLWVLEPDGTKVFYSAPKSKSGGELSPDQTQGYGPERYQVKKALPGEYTILVHYYRANANLLGGETHVSITIRQKAGSAEERVERRTVLLRKQGDQRLVGKVKF
jgi:hypothetical protein